jgi:hypothetical protein
MKVLTMSALAIGAALQAGSTPAHAYSELFVMAKIAAVVTAI